MSVNNILLIAKSKGYTQEIFAEKVGLSRFGLKNGLQNETIKLKDLKKIAKILEISLADLFNDVIHSDTLINEKGIQIVQEGTKNYVASNNKINQDPTLKKEIEFLKDKIKFLEQQVQDKEEIINLLKSK
jgi:transcriptional regulator with XRE-family HTH domain